jgi:hypothetical protein
MATLNSTCQHKQILLGPPVGKPDQGRSFGWDWGNPFSPLSPTLDGVPEPNDAVPSPVLHLPVQPLSDAMPGSLAVVQVLPPCPGLCQETRHSVPMGTKITSKPSMCGSGGCPLGAGRMSEPPCP